MTAAADGGIEYPRDADQAEEWAARAHPLIRRGTSSLDYGYYGNNPPSSPAKTKAPKKAAGAASRAAGTTSPSRAASRAGRRLAQTRTARPAAKLSAGGDAGGLLLALVIYPVMLSIIKYGAAGPGKWFRAKWLNQTSGTGTTPTPATIPNTPAQPINPGPPLGSNYTDTGGDWGPRGAFYPSGVFASPNYQLGGKSYPNPHYVPGSKPQGGTL